MSENALWRHPLYQETALIVFLFLLLLGVGLFVLGRTQRVTTAAAWASVKSWFVVTPLLFVAAALPDPWPLAALTATSIFGTKTFYRMVGMYHRSWFVWATYSFIIGLSMIIYRGHDHWYDRFPMLFLGAVSLIPILRNSANQMIQYMALSLMGFIFLGWSLMHMGRMLVWNQGLFIVMYLFILSEFAENMLLMANKYIGRWKPFNKISAYISVEGILASTLLTIALAWAMRHMLPVRTEPFWLLAGVCCGLLGRFGGLLVGVIRRDLGVKDSGVFIIGRDDILARLDKYIFIAPGFYYGFLELMQVYGQ